MRRARAVVVLTLLGLVGVSCGSDDAGEDAVPDASTTTAVPAVGDDQASPPSTTAAGPSTTGAAETTTTPAPAAGIAPGATYVVLGSSIASGFGLAEQTTSCGRSSRSYPQLVAAALDLELVDVTCGGARVPNVVSEAQGEHPPQLEAVTPDAALVTVTVGGNDIGYNGLALACGDPSFVCGAPEDLDAAVVEVRAALAAMLQDIRSAAPDATIVFVTYPREVPAEGNCPALAFTDEEVAIVRSMGEALQEVFLAVVAGTDVVLVDPYAVEADHTACAPEAERWTAGFEVADGFAYHPTALGHEVMAEMILEALQG